MSQAPFEPKITVHVEDFKLAVHALQMLPKDMAEKLEKKILKQAMDPVYWETISRVPVGPTGNLAKAVKIRVRKVARQFFYGEVIVDGSIAPHAHLVEKGHRIVHGERGGKQTVSTKTVPPHPFMMPAWLAKESEVLATVTAEVNKIVEACAVRA